MTDVLIAVVAETILDDLDYERRTRDPHDRPRTSASTAAAVRDRLQVALATYRGNKMLEAYDQMVSEWRDLAGLR